MAILNAFGYAFYVFIVVIWLMTANPAHIDGTALDAIPFMLFMTVVMPLSVLMSIVFIFDFSELLNKRESKENLGCLMPIRLVVTPFLTLLVFISAIDLLTR